MNKSFVIRTLVSGFITLLILIVTSALGLWQYAESQRDDIQNEVLNAPAKEISSVHTSGDYVLENVFAQQVQDRGILNCNDSINVTTATVSGTVCLLEIENELPIALLFSEPLEIITNGEVEVVGRLQPAQSYEPVPLGALGTTLQTELNIHALVHHFETSLYDGFVMVESIQQDAESQQFEMKRERLILPPAGVDVRNLFYAWQWWIFAGFAVLLWSKYVSDEWRKDGRSE
ncbi:MAG: hypothetical protein RIS09_667 [Actinomycetota bacterium]|jgi:cytochrome oxidase assembly protein ShyY1